MLVTENIQVDPLQAISFELKENAITLLSGASGSGKSRLLYALADLIPHQGEMFLQQRPCRQMPPNQWRHKVTLVPSKIEWWHETAAEHFSTQPGNDSLQQLNLTSETLAQPILQLSTGQKQRLALLRAVNHDPQVLLLDEITANLDHENSLAMEAFLNNWVTKPRRAILWCSHDREQITRIADHHFHIHNHQLQESN